MSSVINVEERKSMADSEPQAGKPGFFTIQKKGQGYWTRMGTAIAIVLVAVFTAYNLYVDIPSLFPPITFAPSVPLDHREAMTAAANRQHAQIALAVAAGCLVGLLGFGFFISNKPSNVDFLIATDSEMKKVNWTSRKDLIASTKIVIIFMFGLAMFLFVVDICFQYLFYLAGVLKTPPFGS